MVDNKALEIYLNLSDKTDVHELKQFWNEMSEDEKEHVAYWEKLLALSEKGELPQIIDEPFLVYDELSDLEKKIDRLVAESKDTISTQKAFLAAFYLEFFLLHPAIGQLLGLLESLSLAVDPEDKYDLHINKFIDTLQSYMEITPELELFTKIIRRLWEENKKLTIQSMYDFLSGVLNRRGLFHAIKPLSHLAQRNNYSVGILIVDIDGFKKINDTYGHHKGDEVIRDVAEIIKSQIRASDIIGRYGGDEFMIYFPSIKQAYLQEISEKIQKSVEEETKSKIPVTISIGAVHGLIKNDPEHEVTKLINIADGCFYQAKKEVKNRIVICSS